MSSIWKSEQVRLVLKCILHRLEVSPEKLRVEREGEEVKISSVYKGFADDEIRIYVCLNEKNNAVWMSLGGQSSHYYPNSWWWKEKEIKTLSKKIISFADPSSEAVQKAVLACFPEAVDIEAENVLLIDEIPKK